MAEPVEESESSFMQDAVNVLYDIRIQIEYRVIIPVIEGLVRLWLHLDPRVYAQALRIKGVTEGNVGKKSNRFVVFVLYSKAGLPAFTANLIEAVGRSDLNLIIVVNTKLESLIKARLLDQCFLLVERANLGRDFGAYRDAIGILLRRFKTVDRLILLNDSLFYFERGLDQFVARLNGSQDFIGTTEVFEYHYHVQSFALSFGTRVINNKRFRKFWRRFRPISTRRWSIHKGEVSLTRRLTKSGFRPHILYQAAELRARLEDLPVRGLLETAQLLPAFFRTQIFKEIDAIFGQKKTGEVGVLEAISQGVKSLNADKNMPGDGSLQSIGVKAEAMERWSFDILADKIVATIAKRNQIHVGGFLFMKYLGLPAVKRDIFYRDVYTLEDVHRILTEFSEPLKDEAMADLRRSGTAAHLNPFMKLLFRHGSI